MYDGDHILKSLKKKGANFKYLIPPKNDMFLVCFWSGIKEITVQKYIVFFQCEKIKKISKILKDSTSTPTQDPPQPPRTGYQFCSHI